MKTYLLLLFATLLAIPATVLAHKPLLMVDDNGDGTIYIETGFSDGSSGAGHTVQLKQAANGKLLKEVKIPEEGSLDLEIPDVPYIVVFNAGEGHVVKADGPAPSGASEAEEIPAPEVESESSRPESQTAETPVLSHQTLSAVPAASIISQPSVSVGPGFHMAYKMMIGSQIFISIGIFLTFGILMLFIGQRWERSRQKRP